MGIFSSIGKIFKKATSAATSFLGGPWGGLAGAGIDFLLNKESAKDAAKDAYEYSQMSLEDQYQLTKRLELDKYGWLVEGAQNAGFNPLTVLGKTGGPQLAGQTQSISPIAVQSYIGEALSTAAGNFQGPEDPIQKEGRILDNKLKMAKLAQLSSEVNRLGTPTGHALSPKQMYVRNDAAGPPVTMPVDPARPAVRTGFGVTDARSPEQRAAGESREFDSDAWLSALSGRLTEDAANLVDSNLSPITARAVKALGNAFIPENYIDAGRDWLDWRSGLKADAKKKRKENMQNFRDELIRQDWETQPTFKGVF